MRAKHLFSPYAINSSEGLETNGEKDIKKIKDVLPKIRKDNCMKKSNVKSTADQIKQFRDTWRTIEDALIAEHSFLLPSGIISTTVTLPWTRENLLGQLKREGRIVSWEQLRDFSEGNMRQYKITIDGSRI